MTEEWRLIRTGFNDAFTNMAMDEAMLISRIEGIVPNTVRFYKWKPSAVSLGFSQQVEKEVDVEACRRLGIEIVRRPTGGGAVYHDSQGELTYSVAVSYDAIPSDVLSSYRHLCKGIIIACGKLGLDAQMSFDDQARQCPNITINGKKISGSAQTRRRNVLLQHGTILLDSNLEIMTKVLKMGRPTACMPLERLQSRVTTLRRTLERPVPFEEVEEKLRLGFEEALNIRLSEQAFSSLELRQASELRLRKYSTYEWNFSR
jgi:lipoate-protein ligase A